MQLVGLFIWTCWPSCHRLIHHSHRKSLNNNSKADACTHSAPRSLYPTPSYWLGWMSFVLNVVTYEPFVVCEFVAMVIPGDNVHEEYVLGFWVESCDLHLITGEHPPTGNIARKNQHSLFKTFKHDKIIPESWFASPIIKKLSCSQCFIKYMACKNMIYLI